MNEIRYPKVLVVLCCLALHIATLSAQNDSVRFFNEVDTSFCKVHVGQDVRVGYYSTGDFDDVRSRWTTVRRSWCRARILRGRQGLLCKRQAGESSLHGNYYIVRFKKKPVAYSAFGTGHDRREDAYLLYDEGLRTSCREYRRSGL